ncbi:MAG: hypothetical protein EOS04_24065 [Mesorhizobium sp.]|nr:MAG: hypothetical protein EOR98_26400 [Mesorhizobium sp.]RWN73221.1 MAG: hypothetical protein EOS01_27155 [Mesorhizobium sp.]RWN85125.1 MAG: hypothetical protein EOS04_24065 [Mesorhizobium sp.]
MTLYLCKMDPNVPGDAKFLAIVGAIVEVRNWSGGDAPDSGYQFIPHVSAHKRSRKVWSSANACIPKWTEQHGFCQLLDDTELRMAQRMDRISKEKERGKRSGLELP